VTLGKEQARWGYLLILTLAFGLVILGVAFGWMPLGALAMLLSLPVAWRATRALFQHYQERALIKSNAATIQLQALAGLLMAAGLLGWAILS